MALVFTHHQGHWAIRTMVDAKSTLTWQPEQCEVESLEENLP